MRKERFMYYDLIRITACFLVITNHTIWVFDSYNQIPLSTWMTSNTIFFICKMSVPLFIMLSGALLLGKEESYKDLFISKILKIIGIIIIWSLIYDIYYNKSFLPITNIFVKIKSIIKNPISIHFWYLYMLIGLYIMTPFIRKMIKNFSYKDFIIFLSIWIIYSTLLPFVGIFKTIEYSSFISIPLFSGYIGYYIMGYYLNNLTLNKKNIKIISFTFLIGLIISTGTTLVLSNATGYTSRALDNVLMFPIMVMSSSFFLLIKEFGCKINDTLNKEKIKSIIINISSKTFGIYLIHMMLINIVCQTSVYDTIFNNNINPILSLFIYDILIFGLSYIIISILHRIPLVKNIA